MITENDITTADDSYCGGNERLINCDKIADELNELILKMANSPAYDIDDFITELRELEKILRGAK